MKALILRLDAPMMSFGGVIIDQRGVIDRFPGTALLTGLFANALGWQHGDIDRLEALQERIEFAARWDVSPRRMVDYHTVDLGQPKMREGGWTTRGVSEHRAGGPDAKFGTHQRYRHYWDDGLMTVALALNGDTLPDVENIAEALWHPARPLFLGRKTCLPARPLLDPKTPLLEADNVLDALRRVEPWDRMGVAGAWKEMEACWPAALNRNDEGQVERVYDLRDWRNQLPAGSHMRASGRLSMSGLHMIELWPQEAYLFHFLQGQGMNDAGDEDLGYGVHAWLKAAFGTLAPKPFRLLSKHGRPLRILAYAWHDRETLSQRLAEFADPTVYTVCPPEKISSRKMPVRWTVGRCLDFEVLCCPVVRKEGIEKDVFLARADRLGPDAGLSRTAVYCQWLERRMGEAVQFVDLRLQKFRLVKQCRQKWVAPGNRRKHFMVRPQAMFIGEFTIQNEAAFHRLLVCGIGRHRAFGYGMLLLRPTS